VSMTESESRKFYKDVDECVAHDAASARRDTRIQ
jgi:hypothetical protein